MKRDRLSIVHWGLMLMFLLMPLAASAQGKKVTLNCDATPLTEAIQEVEKQSGYYKVNYVSSDLSPYKVTVNISSQSAPDAVTQLLAGLPFTTSVKGKYIQVNRQRGGNRTITGRLFDSQGEPLVGATVKEVGTKNVTVTDTNGHYELRGVADGAELEFSYIGMKPYRRKASDKTTDIILEDDANTLGDVIVTGMQRVDRRLFTGATETIDAQDAKLDGVADISRSLEGKAAGVSVQNVSGTFGTAPKIRVRGATSIYGSSKPLWVVDGVIMEDVTDVSADDLSSGDAETLISSAIAGLNSDDIESFQILKDGSATSIYGARAMAGVIVVTTKKGKQGHSRISYTGEYTMRLKPSYHDFNIMNSQEQMDVYREMQNKGWFNMADTYRASESGVFGKMYQLMNTYDPVSHTFALENTEEAEALYLKQAEYRNTNWFDELFSNAIQHNHSVSVSGGTEKFNFYGSVSAMVDPGWYKQSKVNRYTANMNVTYNISSKLSLNVITSGSYRKQKAPGTLSQTVDPVYGEVKRDFDINPYSYAINASRTLDPNTFYTRNYASFNEKYELENNYMNLDVADLKFQAELKYKPISGLELSVLGSAKYAGTMQEHIITDNSNQAQAYRAMPDATVRDRNPWLYTDPDDPYSLPISVLPQGGIYQKTDNKMNSYDFRATANYNHTFNKIHTMNLFGGMEVSRIDRNRNYFNGWGMQYTKGEIPFYTYQFFKQSIEEGTDYYSLSNTYTRTAAFFANGTYSYKGRYVLNGTFRYEGTNRLGKARSSRWLPTWNVSGAWNVHEEPFFNKLEPALSHLTLKASYSLTGDPGPTDVSNAEIILHNYKPYRPFTDIQENGITIESLGNSELTYEKKHELNIGLDAGFLNNRINFSLDWYRRNNYDLIGIVRTTGVGGENLKLANVASMRSHGVEFTISSKNIQTDDFSWNTNLIFSYTKNKVTELQSYTTLSQLMTGNGFALEGYPVRGLFSFKFDGLNDYGLPIITNQDGVETSVGSDFNFQAQYYDNIVYEGPTDPTTTGSFGNIFTYKGFRLNVFITYSFGNKIRLDPVFKEQYSDLDAMSKDFKNRYVQYGDEATTTVPVILSKRQVSYDSYLRTLYNAYNYSTDRVAKGDFIRMKEISLTYDFPKPWLKPLKLSDLSLKLQATNLFLIYSDKKLNGQDPEFFRSGGVAAPMPKQLTMTLKLGI